MTTYLLRKIFFLVMAIPVSYICHGQPISGNNPLGALPVKYNSSFAGQAGTPRLNSAVSYTNYTLGASWGNVWGSSFFTSYDQFIPAIASGISITSGTDYFHHQNYQLSDSKRRYAIQSTSIAIAPKISIKGKYTLSPSLDFTYNYFSNVEKSHYTSPLYHFRNFAFNPSQNFLQSRAALLFNTNKFYVGYSIYLLNQRPAFDKINKESVYSHLSYLQMGYTFQQSPEANFSFTPQVVVNFKNIPSSRFSIGMPDINLNFRYKRFNWGLNQTYTYSSGIPSNLHFGWQNHNMRIVLSTYVPLFFKGDNIYLSNSLSFRYIFNNKSKQHLLY